MRLALFFMLCGTPAFAFTYGRCTRLAAQQRVTGLEAGALASDVSVLTGFIAFSADRSVPVLPAALVVNLLSLFPLLEMTRGCVPTDSDEAYVTRAFTSQKEARDYRESAIQFERFQLIFSLASNSAMLAGARTNSARAVIGLSAAVPLAFLVKGLVQGDFSPERPMDLALRF